MTILNITFLIEPAREREFISWMRAEGVELLHAGNLHAAEPRLLSVKAMQGMPAEPGTPKSLALHMEFADTKAAEKWRQNSMPSLVAAYDKKFGPQALFFATELETVDF